MAEDHKVVYLRDEVVTDHESRLHYVMYKIFRLLGHRVIRRSPIWLPATGSACFQFLRRDFYVLSSSVSVLYSSGRILSRHRSECCWTGRLRHWCSLPLQGPWSLCQGRIPHCQQSLWGMSGGGGLMFCSAPSPFLWSGASPLRHLLPLTVVFVRTSVFFEVDHSPCALTSLAVKVRQFRFDVWL